MVMVLIGILAAIAYPAIDSMRYNAESAMMQIGTALQAAQREAVARQHDVLVIFDAPNTICGSSGGARRHGPLGPARLPFPMAARP